MATRILADRLQLARDRCAQWVKEDHTPALSVCVRHRGKVVLDECWGVMGPEDGAPPLTHEALWPLSSLTKSITATLAMQLVEDGRLGLNRPAKDYLPQLSGEGAENILVHHLLTHTSGYVYYDEEPLASHVANKLTGGLRPPPDCPDTQHPTVNLMLSLFWDAPLDSRPGEQMIYADLNYQFLGEIIRRLSGRRLWELAQERVFGPLGMENSYYVVPESEAGRVVQRPLAAPMAAPQSPLNQGIGSRQMQETPYASAGVFSTPTDIGSFGQMFMEYGSLGGERILSPASVAAMTRDQIPGVPARFGLLQIPIASWGYGWAVESPVKWKYHHGSLWPLGVFSHSGGGGVNLWVDREHEIVGVYFEACIRGNPETKEQFWNVDLFQNLITSAVV
jgi:CubicO group peptidase (beta-lactamase class C family)